MAAIDTLSGITEITPNFYEVTSVVDIGSGIDDVTDATFIMKDGGLIRWTNGCTTTFTRCTFVETSTCQALGADNFGLQADDFVNNSGRSRWYSAIISANDVAPVFKGCEWQCNLGARSDFDVQSSGTFYGSPSFLKDEYGKSCKVTLDRDSAYPSFAQFNHFASNRITTTGLIIDHKIGAQGAFEFANIPDDVDQMSGIVIVDNHPDDIGRHAVLLGYNVPNGGEKTVKGFGARNIALFGGGFDYALNLIDPVGLVRKAFDAAEANDGKLKGYRTVSGNLINANSQSVDGRTIFISELDDVTQFDSYGSDFSVPLQCYEEDWDSNVLDTSMQDYTRIYAGYGYSPQTSVITIEEDLTDPLAYASGSVLLFADDAVTKTLAQAEAMTSVDSAQDLYDGLHYYSVYREDGDRYVGASPVSASGSTLDFGDYDVVIDPALDMPYPALWTPTGQTHPLGATGTYSLGLVINNDAATVVEQSVTFAELDAQSAGSSSDHRLASLFWKPDGTSFYLHAYPTNSDTLQTVMQWNLTTPFDFSTATYYGSKTGESINGQAGQISFSANGTRITISKRWGNWYYADLTTAWDITTASPWTSVSWDTGRVGHCWASDGLTLIAIEDSRSNWRGALKIYTASVPFDISSIFTWQGTTIQFGTNTNGWVTSATGEKWMNSVCFADNGNFFIMHNGASGKVFVFELDTPYVVPTDLDINNAVEVIKVGTLGLETVGSFVTNDKVYFVEIRDNGYDGNQILNVHSLSATVPVAYAGDENTIYIKSSNIASDQYTTLQTTGFFTLQNGATSGCQLIDANGISASISITNVVAGSRVYLYNVTKDTLLDNSISPTSSYSYSYLTGVAGAVIDQGDVLVVRLAYCDGTTAYNWFSAFITAGEFGGGTQASQELLEAYPLLGVDGSTVTEFTLDIPNIDVDISDPDGISQKRRLVAWLFYIIANDADGMANFFGAIDLPDGGNAILRSGIIDVELDNTGSTQVFLNDSDFWLHRDDGATFIKYPSSGGYGISNDSGKVYIAETGVSGLTSAESTQLFAIPTEGSGGGATAVEIRQEIDSNSTQLASIKSTVEAIPTDTYTIPDYSTELANIQSAVDAVDTESLLDELEVINEGVKKSSLIVPHTTNLV
jgi:hypothetical protein